MGSHCRGLKAFLLSRFLLSLHRASQRPPTYCAPASVGIEQWRNGHPGRLGAHRSSHPQLPSGVAIRLATGIGSGPQPPLHVRSKAEEGLRPSARGSALSASSRITAPRPAHSAAPAALTRRRPEQRHLRPLRPRLLRHQLGRRRPDHRRLSRPSAPSSNRLPQPSRELLRPRPIKWSLLWPRSLLPATSRIPRRI